jgi:hypothetical protein
MNKAEIIRNIALSFPATDEKPHFEKPSFRVKGKIFVVHNQAMNRISVKLSEVEQSIFCAFDNSMIYKVPNKWGSQGWTLVELENVPLELLEAIMMEAYCEVAPKQLGEQVKSEILKNNKT